MESPHPVKSHAVRLLERLEDIIGAGWRDIHDWIAFAERQMREMPEWGHTPYGPTTSGVAISQGVKARLGPEAHEATQALRLELERLEAAVEGWQPCRCANDPPSIDGEVGCKACIRSPYGPTRLALNPDAWLALAVGALHCIHLRRVLDRVRAVGWRQATEEGLLTLSRLNREHLAAEADRLAHQIPSIPIVLTAEARQALHDCMVELGVGLDHGDQPSRYAEVVNLLAMVLARPNPRPEPPAARPTRATRTAVSILALIKARTADRWERDALEEALSALEHRDRCGAAPTREGAPPPA